MIPIDREYTDVYIYSLVIPKYSFHLFYFNYFVFPSLVSPLFRSSFPNWAWGSRSPTSNLPSSFTSSSLFSLNNHDNLRDTLARLSFGSAKTFSCSRCISARSALSASSRTQPTNDSFCAGLIDYQSLSLNRPQRYNVNPLICEILNIPSITLIHNSFHTVFNRDLIPPCSPHPSRPSPSSSSPSPPSSTPKSKVIATL